MRFPLSLVGMVSLSLIPSRVAFAEEAKPELLALEASAPGGEWFPFFVDKLGLPIVDLEIGGARARVVLATAGETAISEQLAARLSIRFTHAGARSYYGKRDGMVAEHLALGRLDVGDVNVTGLAIGDVDVDAVLGRQIFERVDVVVAADLGIVGIFPRGSGRLPPGYTEVALDRTVNGAVRVVATLPTREREGMTLDSTAASSTIALRGGHAVTIRYGVESARVDVEPSHPSIFGADLLFRRRTLISFSRLLVVQAN